MLRLHGRTTPWDAAPCVLRVTRNAALDVELRRKSALVVDDAGAGEGAVGFAVVLGGTAGAGVVGLPAGLARLSEGDVVRLVPRVGEVSVLYRRASPHNSMLLTERCNSNCVMCSQPPKAADDSYLVDVWLEAVRLMSPETADLGISGGEPTLLGARFIELLAACRASLPRTAVHVLSNGRLFRYLRLARAVADVGLSDLMVGVPLYSDLASRHDYVVQAAGAFDDTLRGIINLKRSGVRVELRVVLHRDTIGRLPQLARYIARNLPFVDHVALMGLEQVGFAKANLDALWVDPTSYQSELRAAVDELRRARLSVSIYNHQLCIIERALWPYAKRSISDWKNEYIAECEGCSLRADCGGFFGSTKRSSVGIQARAGESLDSRPLQ